jgi:hypothetical protein
MFNIIYYSNKFWPKLSLFLSLKKECKKNDNPYPVMHIAGSEQ